MFKKLSDKDLVEGIRSQNDKVLNYLYSSYYSTVKNHVLKNSGTPDDVSDVFQDAVIILYQKICENNFTLSSELKGYFFGIARNVWNGHLRQKRRTEELTMDVAEEFDDDSAETVFLKIMTRAFNKLKPDCQAVLTMYYDGCSYEEIASAMKLKNDTYARRKKYLCKEALMEFIREDPEYKEYQRFLK